MSGSQKFNLCGGPTRAIPDRFSNRVAAAAWWNALTAGRDDNHEVKPARLTHGAAAESRGRLFSLIRSAIISSCAGATDFRGGSRSLRSTLMQSSTKKTGARVTTSLPPSRSRHPPAARRTPLRAVDCPLGSNTSVGEGCDRRCPDDKRRVGDCGDPASLPRCDEVTPVHCSCRWILRATEVWENQTAMLV
jgi:hypothetical protein